MPVHFSHKTAVNVSYISHICQFILLLLVIFISYLIVTSNILLSFLQATNIAFDRIFVYEIFFVCPAGAVSCWAFLCFSCWDICKGTIWKWSIGWRKKRKISKENVQLPGKVFRYAELLPPCGIHMSSWDTVQLILKQYLAFPTE